MMKIDASLFNHVRYSSQQRLGAPNMFAPGSFGSAKTSRLLTGFGEAKALKQQSESLKKPIKLAIEPGDGLDPFTRLRMQFDDETENYLNGIDSINTMRDLLEDRVNTYKNALDGDLSAEEAEEIKRQLAESEEGLAKYKEQMSGWLEALDISYAKKIDQMAERFAELKEQKQLNLDLVSPVDHAIMVYEARQELFATTLNGLMQLNELRKVRDEAKNDAESANDAEKLEEMAQEAAKKQKEQKTAVAGMKDENPVADFEDVLKQMEGFVRETLDRIENPPEPEASGMDISV